MKLTLKRIAIRPTYTIGKLYVDGVYFCDTLEDKTRDTNKDGDLLDEGETKVWSETSIPYGTYDVILRYSPKFKRILPAVINVPHFSGILFHRGNSAKDSHGCILVGENKAVGMVLNSGQTEIKLMAILKDETDIKLDVI